MPLCLRSPLLGELGFAHGFSLRAGGVSLGPYASLNLGRNVGDEPEAVRENHARLAAEIGYAPDALYEVNQVHGGAVSYERGRDADALIGARRGSAVGVRVADCAALLLADPRTGHVAAVHAGWRGVVADVVGNAVRALCELRDSPPGQLAAAVFPCIGPDAFEVGPDVAAQIARAAGPAVIRAGEQPGDKPRVDLQRAVAAQLTAAGLARDRVELVIGCTFSEPTQFFSYRRDHGVTGRHLAVILPRC